MGDGKIIPHHFLPMVKPVERVQEVKAAIEVLNPGTKISFCQPLSDNQARGTRITIKIGVHLPQRSDVALVYCCDNWLEMALSALLPPGAGSIDLRRTLLLLRCLLIGGTYSLEESLVSVRIVDATGKTVQNRLQIVTPVSREVTLTSPNKLSSSPEFYRQLLCPFCSLQWIQILQFEIRPLHRLQAR